MTKKTRKELKKYGIKVGTTKHGGEVIQDCNGVVIGFKTGKKNRKSKAYGAINGNRVIMPGRMGTVTSYVDGVPTTVTVAL